MEAMGSDRSSKLCGDCHTETYFEWQVSAHRSEGLECTGCHDPHATSLKARKEPGDLCASCHRSRASNFAHSAHSKQGLTCIDCHLAKLEGENGEGHARLDHSFSVRLSTCNSCHAYQMHDPAEVHTDNPTPAPPDPLTSVETLTVTEKPNSVNPVGFSAMFGLLGLAAGIFLSPYLERWNRRK
jgi:predicted CXXCH cytochrome family protein